MSYLICVGPVLCRFANSLPINDPLQTVYQLMSGRMPASATVSFSLSLAPPCSSVLLLRSGTRCVFSGCATLCFSFAFQVKICVVFMQCCGEEKWGDWRPHLAMVLSNLTHTLDLDTRTISTMGDTLGRNASKLNLAAFNYIITIIIIIITLLYSTFQNKVTKCFTWIQSKLLCVGDTCM